MYGPTPNDEANREHPRQPVLVGVLSVGGYVAACGDVDDDRQTGRAGEGRRRVVGTQSVPEP